jgi:oxygen-independent coproporphyrinogen-3 oxidase
VGFSVYIHFPYCLSKCPYCDFNTYAVRGFPEERYTRTLLREAAVAADNSSWAGRDVSTVFFGGGTPSLMAPATIALVLDALERSFGLAADAEITLEANPGSLEGVAKEKLGAFRAAGVNRLSLGGQSFDARHLATLGRIHEPRDTVDAIEAARTAGFDNLSCDLMFAVPEQTLEQWQSDLRRLIAIGPDHVSAYNLTYERGTPLTGLLQAGRIQRVGEEWERAMYEAAISMLADAGFRHYEISNWASPGRESRHNLSYWTWSDYLGLGAGAHGFAAATPAPRDRPDWGTRYANLKLPETYMSAGTGAWSATVERLDREMAIAEFLLLGLRLSEGIDETRFAALFDEPFDEAVPAAAALIAGGMLRRNDGRIMLTHEGLMLADSVIGHAAAA